VFNGVSDETNKYNIKEEKSTYYEMGYDILKTDFDRNVYRLVYKEGYSKTMAAEILGCDVKKVYNSIQKIKGLLQELSY
jgi:DNA-directed RNA polymerase specialized sigma24 family protein